MPHRRGFVYPGPGLAHPETPRRHEKPSGYHLRHRNEMGEPASPARRKLAATLNNHRGTRAPDLAVFPAACCERAAAACSRNAYTRRREALAQTTPMRLAKAAASGRGSLASDKPSGHGGAKSLGRGRLE